MQFLRIAKRGKEMKGRVVLLEGLLVLLFVFVVVMFCLLVCGSFMLTFCF